MTNRTVDVWISEIYRPNCSIDFTDTLALKVFDRCGLRLATLSELLALGARLDKSNKMAGRGYTVRVLGPRLVVDDYACRVGKIKYDADTDSKTFQLYWDPNGRQLRGTSDYLLVVKK